MTRSAQGGRRPDLGNRYFRSAWEANYARYLNWLVGQGEIASWEYEAKTFNFPVRRGNVSYTPDFLVRSPDGSEEFHEVKGWMDGDSAVKLRRMQKHYPNVRIIVVDKEAYRSIKQSVSGMIEGWEHGHEIARE